ncbi:hypothetical protein KOR42_39500 [Thalassoglobus neptunius]|uniref:Uncharacterized protein n=1 Tax=Thalassoglobus neptunius TaxID=1938619 RepID=A0A5C5WE75_9PLAN|nr:hypothetical protein [Thalassoglobus neptunius]TWT49034.1 hypothetical protein KOR42_39500 [Thalassoglobus neptunius]
MTRCILLVLVLLITRVISAGDPDFRLFAEPMLPPVEGRSVEMFRTFDSLPTAIADGEVDRFRTFAPADTDQAEEELVEKEPHKKPTAFLITPTFPCPACEQFKRRRDELPFELRPIVRSTSPVLDQRGRYIWPVLWYPVGDGRWKYFQGSIDQYLEKHTKNDDGLVVETSVR